MSVTVLERLLRFGLPHAVSPDDWYFAIIADPHCTENSTDPRNVNLIDAATQIKSYNSAKHPIEFVLVLGDLIQGEVDTPGSYEREFQELKTELEGSLPAPLNYRYMPVMGNHDVWCNLTGSDVITKDPLTGNPLSDIVPYDPNSGDSSSFGKYPEYIFDGIFKSQYANLQAWIGSSWKKQAMPISNPYQGTTLPPNIYFQNFAFDYKNVHFICADFCSRDDFSAPGFYNKPVGLGNMPIYGYAMAHDLTAYSKIGTFNWLKDHLQHLNPDQRSSSWITSILLAHHPPLYELQFTYNSWPVTLLGHETFGFVKADYDKLAQVIPPIPGSPPSLPWYAGHGHLEGTGWGGFHSPTDTTESDTIQWIDTCPMSGVPIIPSSMACTSYGPFKVPSDFPLIINGTHSGIPSGNGRAQPTNGRVTIVHVNIINMGPQPRPGPQPQLIPGQQIK
jgi:hypothetical protein